MIYKIQLLGFKGSNTVFYAAFFCKAFESFLTREFYWVGF